MPCQRIPYHTIPYHTIPYHTIPYHTIPCHAMPCHAMPCHAMPCHAMPCHAMPCHAMPCHAMPCHATPCHAMPCHAIPTQCGFIQSSPTPKQTVSHDKQSYLVPICDILEIHEPTITIGNFFHQFCCQSNAVNIHPNSGVRSHQNSKVDGIPKVFKIRHSLTIELLQSYVRVAKDKKQIGHLTSEDKECKATDVEFKSHRNYTLKVENPSEFGKLKKEPY